MHVDFNLNRNDLEALLRHCDSYSPTSDDPPEDARLQDTLEALRAPLEIADILTLGLVRLPDAWSACCAREQHGQLISTKVDQPTFESS